MDYKYKFSVVIPVYNVAGYLAETLDSVIGQSIGFEKNIQIILVNDGSPDDSEKICLAYAEKYPDNILYLKQENKGVSAARNYGCDYVEGKYVNFLDSDDKWTEGSFQAVYDFFEKHPEAAQDCWLTTTKAPRSYQEARFSPNSWIFFGKETAGLPMDLRERFRDRCIRLPMIDEARSLNLSNTVAVCVYEALRQNDFPGLLGVGEMAKTP